MRRPVLILALLAPLLAAACSDRAIYVERSGVNMKLAVNDDPSTPIQVNLGLQRGIITVVPALAEGSQGEASGEAGSLISGFDYVNGSSVPIAGGAEGLPASTIKADVSIRTSFASGNAASLISYPAEYRTDDDGNVILGKVSQPGAANATRAVTLVATAAGGVPVLELPESPAAEARMTRVDEVIDALSAEQRRQLAGALMLADVDALDDLVLDANTDPELDIIVDKLVELGFVEQGAL